jgi:DNA topoisomerase-3
MACCSRNARGRSSRVVVSMGGETFSASGLVVLERNWLDVYPYTAWSGAKIPNFAVGQRFTPAALLLSDGSTQPPPMLAEHELIAVMNEQGIGTDATIPEHIAKVQDRE